jgi:hypothetical protein
VDRTLVRVVVCDCVCIAWAMHQGPLMVVVERAVAAMDAHREEVAAVESGLGFLRNMSCVRDKVWGVCVEAEGCLGLM